MKSKREKDPSPKRMGAQEVATGGLSVTNSVPTLQEILPATEPRAQCLATVPLGFCHALRALFSLFPNENRMILLLQNI